MKILLFLFCTATLFASEKNPIKSSIKAVTVYTENASIKREATVKLIPGSNELRFNNLSPDIDKSSIQMEGLKETTISSLRYETAFLEQKKASDAYLQLEKTMDSLENEKSFLQNEIKGFEEEMKLLQNNQRINSDATDLTVEKVKQMAFYYRNRTTEIKNEIYKLRLKSLYVGEEVLKYENEKTKLQDSKSAIRGNFIVKIDSKTATTLQLKITYTIKNAGWFPTYDIKGTDVDAPIDFTYKANVYQQSGTDWENVQITLSTGDPTVNTNKPHMLPKYLNFVSASYTPSSAIKRTKHIYNPTVTEVSGFVYDASGLPLPGANVILKGTNKGTQTDYDGKYMLDVTGGRELVISYVGFDSAEIPIASSNMSVSLKENTSSLDEVVITSYGVKSKARKLEGKTAGVSVVSLDDLQLGASNTIMIRGRSSINGQKEPLFIIDGVPSTEDNFRLLKGNDIAQVETIEINQALQLYGNKAKDGVILITTKEHQKNKIGIIKETEVLTTTFKIVAPQTIRSNQEVSSIEIDNFSMPASFNYYVAPEINEQVFLTATISDWKQYDFLYGEATIYFDGSYAGTTVIDPYSIKKKLELSLGVDANVIAKRTKIDNYKSKSFLGGTRIVSRGYEISIKNKKKKTITLILEDRIPVTQNKEIKVEDIEIGDATYDDKKGILNWNMTVSPDDTLSKTFFYVVKFPKHKNISL